MAENEAEFKWTWLVISNNLGYTIYGYKSMGTPPPVVLLMYSHEPVKQSLWTDGFS